MRHQIEANAKINSVNFSTKDVEGGFISTMTVKFKVRVPAVELLPLMYFYEEEREAFVDLHWSNGHAKIRSDHGVVFKRELGPFNFSIMESFLDDRTTAFEAPNAMLTEVRAEVSDEECFDAMLTFQIITDKPGEVARRKGRGVILVASINDYNVVPDE